MIDKETSKIETDRDKMEKLIKYNMPVQYKKCLLEKKKKQTFSSNGEQSTVFFYEWELLKHT